MSIRNIRLTPICKALVMERLQRDIEYYFEEKKALEVHIYVIRYADGTYGVVTLPELD